MSDIPPEPREWKSIEYMREQRAYCSWRSKQSTLRMTLTTSLFGLYIAWFQPLLGFGLVGVSIYGYIYHCRKENQRKK